MGNQPGKLQSHTQSGRPKKNVHWKSAERPSAPGRPILMSLSDQQPDVVHLCWERPKLDGGSPITGYIVEQRRMGSPHWVRATPTPVPQCKASISGLEPGWRYQFRVFAENIVGRSAASELSDVLTVTLQRNAITVPRFVNELQDTQAVEDERIEFRVRIIGEPTPEINWFKDGYEIFSSRRTKIVNDNDVSVLIIHQVALTDEGEIKCTATNRAGHVVTKAKLLVQAPPKIRLPRTYEDGLIVEADETLRLKVGIAGQPPPVVTWLHEGETVSESGRFEITNAEKNSLLKINNVKREDRGEYTVRAWNNLGEDVTSFLVTVTARPNPPGKVLLNMSFGKSATLSWTAPIDDGGCKIGNYIVEYFRVGWNVWLKAATTRSLSTTLHDLIEGSEYKFRVKAENPYGVSDPSEESDILFIPDPKRGITKPKSASRVTEEQSKPVPPRRKTLSPSRPQEESANETSSRISPPLVRKPKPQLLDNEDLHREMSYGTSDKALKSDVRKSPSMSSADSNATSNQSKLNLKLVTSALSPTDVLLATTTSTTSTSAATTKILATPTNTKNITTTTLTTTPAKSPQRSPTAQMKQFLHKTTAAIVKSSNHTKTAAPQPLPLPSLKELKNSAAPTENNLERKRSLSPIKKLLPLRKSPTPPEPIKSTAALNRSAEPVQLGVNQQVRRFSGHSLSPAKNAPALAIAIATSSMGRDDQKSPVLPNPTIQISAPPIPISEQAPSSTLIKSRGVALIPNTLAIDNSDSSTKVVHPLSAAGKQDDVHTSNEFMLVVFDKNSKVQENDKQSSFELDLEDAIQPPPISISAPDLSFLEFSNLHSTFPLRRSVSSTELLYERAMARFYEAVELEEAEKVRKTKASQDKYAATNNTQPNSTFRKRLGSMTEAERLSFEKRSEMRRQSTDIIQDLKKSPQKWGSHDNIRKLNPLTRATVTLLQSELTQEDHGYDEDVEEDEELEEQDDGDLVSDEEYKIRKTKRKEDNYDLGSDYTESTASSEQDSIEKFKMELMARTHSPSPRDLETYHPRNMSAAIFTPYRAPTPEQAAVILNRPMPLASPDFVPKPILKRPSNENVEQNIDGASINANNTNNNTNSVKMDLAKGLKSLFNRDKRSPTEKNTEENQKISDLIEKTNTIAIATELESKRKAKEEENLKRKEAERLMLEEAHAAVDHYSDLVRQVSSTQKYHTPLYLDREKQQKVAAKAATEGVNITDEEDDITAEFKLRRSQSPENDMLLTPPTLSNKPRLSLSERGQMIHVRETASDLAIKNKPIVQDSPSDINSEPPDFALIQPEVLMRSETVVSETVGQRIDARGRPRLVKVKRIIKRRVPSSTRSRDASINRPPIDINVKNSETCNSETSLTLIKARNELLANAEQSEEEAHEKVRSALSYSTDLILFAVACYVYLFKDARLVLPILALMVYRQLGEAISKHIPNWMKRKRS